MKTALTLGPLYALVFGLAWSTPAGASAPSCLDSVRHADGVYLVLDAGDGEVRLRAARAGAADAMAALDPPVTLVAPGGARLATAAAGPQAFLLLDRTERLHLVWSATGQVSSASCPLAGLPADEALRPGAFGAASALGAGVPTDAAVDPVSGRALVCGYDPAGGGSVWLARETGGAWPRETVAALTGPTAPRVAASRHGTVHVVWRAADGKVRHLHSIAGGRWLRSGATSERPEIIGRADADPQLCCTRHQILAVLPQADGGFDYSLYTGQNWDTNLPLTKLEGRTAGYPCSPPGLVVDDYDVPRLFTVNRDTGDLFSTRWLGFGWTDVLPLDGPDGLDHAFAPSSVPPGSNGFVLPVSAGSLHAVPVRYGTANPVRDLNLADLADAGRALAVEASPRPIAVLTQGFEDSGVFPGAVPLSPVGWHGDGNAPGGRWYSFKEGTAPVPVETRAWDGHRALQVMDGPSSGEDYAALGQGLALAAITGGTFTAEMRGWMPSTNVGFLFVASEMSKRGYAEIRAAVSAGALLVKSAVPNAGACAVPTNAWFGIRFKVDMDRSTYDTWFDDGGGWRLADAQRAFIRTHSFAVKGVDALYVRPTGRQGVPFIIDGMRLEADGPAATPASGWPYIHCGGSARLGYMTSLPLRAEQLAGHVLSLDVLADSSNYILAELLRADSEDRIPGYVQEDCVLITNTADNVAVSWKGCSALDGVPDGPFRVRIIFVGYGDKARVYRAGFRPLAGQTVPHEFALAPGLVETSLVYRSSIAPLAPLKAWIGFKPDGLPKPLVVCMHGYGDAAMRHGGRRVYGSVRSYANQGLFGIGVDLRGREESAGQRDDGGSEVMDIYDAVQAALAQYPGETDAANINIIGWSGGGGNTFSAVTRMPDLFSNASAFYGITDYGYWASTTWNGSIQPNVGGETDEVPDRYMARNSLLGVLNNRTTRFQFFWDEEEILCPPWMDEEYRRLALELGCTNIIAHESYSNEADIVRWKHTGGYNAASLTDPPMLARNNPSPQLDRVGRLRVLGYLMTRPFRIFLGHGNDAVAALDYELLADEDRFAFTRESSDPEVRGWLQLPARASSNVTSVLRNGWPLAWEAAADGSVLLRDLALDDHVVVRFAAGASPWDSDGDGLSDAAEAQQTGSDPRSADTDGDGKSDGEEARDGTDPRNAYSYQQIYTYQQGVAGYRGTEDVYLNAGGPTDNFGARDGLYHWAGVPILMRFRSGNRPRPQHGRGAESRGEHQHGRSVLVPDRQRPGAALDRHAGVEFRRALRGAVRTDDVHALLVF